MSEEDNTMPGDPEDEEGPRFAWKVVSCIIVALTLLLNIVIVGVIVVNRNANSVVNKGKNTYREGSYNNIRPNVYIKMIGKVRNIYFNFI